MPAPQQHRFTYNEAMPVESCTQALSDLALRFGEDDDEEGGMVRLHWLCLTVPLPRHLHKSRHRITPCPRWRGLMEGMARSCGSSTSICNMICLR